MAKNIDFMGAVFPDVPSIRLPQQGGGLVSFDDTTDATASASDIAEGKTAYVNGSKITGTASGGSATIEALSVTANGTYTAPSGVDGYSPVTVNVSGGALKPIVLRPDAELVQKWTYDKLLVEDEGITLPAYSTSAKSLRAVEDIGTATVDVDNYDYVIAHKYLFNPIYGSGTGYGSGRFAYSAYAAIYEIITIPANTISDNGVYASEKTVSSTKTMNNNICVYWSGSTTLKSAQNQGYGVYINAWSAPTLSSSTLTVKIQPISIRGNTTYFTSTYMNALSDIRAQAVIELWKYPKHNLGIDGHVLQSGLMHIIDCQQTTGNLT